MLPVFFCVTHFHVSVTCMSHVPPLQINVVKESRPYSLWQTPSGGTVTSQTGILAAKFVLNQLHQQLADEGFSQVSTCVLCWGGWGDGGGGRGVESEGEREEGRMGERRRGGKEREDRRRGRR